MGIGRGIGVGVGVGVGGPEALKAATPASASVPAMTTIRVWRSI